MSVKRSLDTTFVIALLVLLFASGLFYREHRESTVREASSHLRTMLMLRESVLRSYFESLRSEVVLWSSRPIVIDVLRKLSADFARDGVDREMIGQTSVDELGSRPSTAPPGSLDERVRAFAIHHQYYDVFFIGKQGDILYTVAKEDDLGTNLVDGPYSKSGLGRLFRGLEAADESDQVVFEDFSNYAPSAGEPAAFIGSPVYSGRELIGYYAVQIPAEPINAIMQFSAGMGKTGETYLVGRDGLMRSNSRFLEESSILRTTVSGPTVDGGLAGDIGLEVVEDYRGVPVFSAYRPFDFEGTRWAVLAEKDTEEVYAPVADTLQWIMAGYGVLVVVLLLFRYMLQLAILPAAVGAFLGFSVLNSIDDT